VVHIEYKQPEEDAKDERNRQKHSKQYEQAYETLDKLSLEEEKRVKIWTIIHYAEMLGDPIPKVRDLSKASDTTLESLLKNYRSKLKPDLVKY
jgi:hypothetical protein